jgi:hypothetical protein
LLNLVQALAPRATACHYVRSTDSWVLVLIEAVGFAWIENKKFNGLLKLPFESALKPAASEWRFT